MILNSPTISGSLTVTGNIITSGSITLSGSVASASYADTASFVALAQSASNAVAAQTASFANAFTVASTLTAQTLVVQTITSSVDFVTGSTRFGSILGNTHVFSGSVTMNPGGLFVSSSGNVGIGTITPANKLTISNNGNSVVAFRINDTNANGSFLSLNASNSDSAIIAGGTSPIPFDIYTSGSVRMRIETDGSMGFNNSILGSRSFVFKAITSRPIVIETVENTGVHSLYLRPNASGRHLISSNYLSGGVYLPLALSGRENDADFVLGINGNIGIGVTTTYVKLNVNGSAQFGSPTLQTSGTEFLFVGQNSSTGPDDGNCLGLYVNHAAASSTPTVKFTYQFRMNDNSGANLYGDALRVTKEAGSNSTFTTFYTNATIGNGVERMRLLSSGDIDFKTYGPNTNLVFKMQGGDTFSTLNNGSGTPMYLNYFGNGAIRAGTGGGTVLYAGSDIRIKKDISIVDSTLDKVLQLTPKTFKYKDNKADYTYYGFIAQEMENVFPELVRTSEGISMCNDEEIIDQKSIESYGLVWASILTKAIQELKAQNDDLQSQINELKAQ
jgi:hypothetical protein